MKIDEQKKDARMGAPDEKKNEVCSLPDWQARLASQAICDYAARGELANLTDLSAIAGAIADALAVINSRTLGA